MRRVLASAALAFCTSTAACQDGDPTPSGPPSSNPPSLAAAGCPVPTTAPVDPGSVLVPGPTNGLPATPARGEAMVIMGVVLDPACRPAAGATVNIWHTDARGLYHPEGTEACCFYQGVALTDPNGRFRLETIRPAQYPEPGAPPAHIHLELRHGSGRQEAEIMFTADQAPATSVRASRTVPVHLSQRDGAHYGEAAFVLEAL